METVTCIILVVAILIGLAIARKIYLHREYKPGTGFIRSNYFHYFRGYHPFLLFDFQICRITLDDINEEYKYARVIKKKWDGPNLGVEIEYWQ